MSIISQVSRYDFEDRFRAIRPDNFTYEGLKALYQYLEQLSDDIGQDIELDVIALCCEYTEYNDFEELQEDYQDIETIEELEDHTTVIPVGLHGLIIVQF